MKNNLKIALNLALICLAIAVALGLLYQATKPVIAQREKEAEAAARKLVLPEAKEFKGEGKVVEGYSDNKLVGYVITAQGEGYSSIIKMLVGLSADYKIKGVTILSQQETPGLGDRASKPDFLNQFPGKGVEQLKLLKGVPQGDDHITAITGATITSRAVTEGVEKAIKEVINKKQ